MGIDPELNGQVVSKVGDHLSVKIRGMTYNTRLKTLLRIGDKVSAKFEGGSRTIIAIRKLKHCDMNADDIFDKFMADDDNAEYCEIEYVECTLEEELGEILCMSQEMME